LDTGLVTGGSFIAVDWGTTNRRAYLIADGEIVGSLEDTLGILAVPSNGYPSAIAALRDALGDFPVLLAGMVGSDRGWKNAGYIECPASLRALAAGIRRVSTDIALVPGVCSIVRDRGDVMRGEEIQLLGAVAAGKTPADALLCQPGTHCKWVRMKAGAIAGFTSVMTGEMFALLRNHALIGSVMTGEVRDGDAFRQGVIRSGEQDLLAALFGVRPASILGLRHDADAAAYVSGLLIGADCRAQIGTGDKVHILATPSLGALYAAAIQEIGGETNLVDSHDAFCAGIARIWELIQ
jgi:2-dehydro-3-deoxygalactonokinase